jgi:hypothetical protein
MEPKKLAKRRAARSPAWATTWGTTIARPNGLAEPAAESTVELGFQW